MKILSISTDRDISKEGSDVRARMIEYGNLVDELNIVVFTKHNADDADNMTMMRITDNVFAYPTNSVSRWLYIFDAVRIGGKLMKLKANEAESWLITSQDPFETGLVGWRLKRMFRIPLQLQIHTDIFSPHFARESFLNRLRVWVARFLIPRADCIRVVSQRIKDSLDGRWQMADGRIKILPIFVDVERIKSTPVSVDLHQKYPGYEKIILMASRLTKEKNIGFAIKAMADVIKEQPRTLLLIVGNGPERKKLKAKSRKLKANVIFEGAVPFETLISYYKTADLYLLTSNYEGYGRTLVEVAAAGSPVVTTDVGISREITGARIVPVGDAAALEQALIEVIRNPLKVPQPPATLSRREYFNEISRLWKTCFKQDKV